MMDGSTVRRSELQRSAMRTGVAMWSDAKRQIVMTGQISDAG